MHFTTAYGFALSSRADGGVSDVDGDEVDGDVVGHDGPVDDGEGVGCPLEVVRDLEGIVAVRASVATF